MAMAAVSRILKAVSLVRGPGAKVRDALSLCPLKKLPNVKISTRHISCTRTARIHPYRTGDLQEGREPYVDRECLKVFGANMANFTDIERAKYVFAFGNGLNCTKYPESDYTRIYTDGAVNYASGRAGVGLWCDEFKGQERANDTKDPEFVELQAIYFGTEYIINQRRHGRKYVIMSDSTKALDHIVGHRYNKGYKQVVQSIIKNVNRLQKDNVELIFAWIPGHNGLPGYREARKMAGNANAAHIRRGEIPFPDCRQIGNDEFMPPVVRVDDILHGIYKEYERKTKEEVERESGGLYSGYAFMKDAVRDMALIDHLSVGHYRNYARIFTEIRPFYNQPVRRVGFGFYSDPRQLDMYTYFYAELRDDQLRPSHEAINLYAIKLALDMTLAKLYYDRHRPLYDRRTTVTDRCGSGFNLLVSTYGAWLTEELRYPTHRPDIVHDINYNADHLHREFGVSVACTSPPKINFIYGHYLADCLAAKAIENENVSDLLKEFGNQEF